MLEAGQTLIGTHASAARLDLDPGQKIHDSHVVVAGVESSNLAPGQLSIASQESRAGGNPSSPPATSEPKSISDSLEGNHLDPGQLQRDTHGRGAGVNDLAADQPARDTYRLDVGGNELRPGQQACDPHSPPAGADLHDAVLALLADAVDDLESVRKATQNRIESLIRIKGGEGTDFEAQLRDQLAQTLALERATIRSLEKAMTAHPLGAFVQSRKGLGMKGMARLLAAVGDPATRPNLGKLWQYCGHGDPLRSRLRKGEDVQYSPKAKTRVWVVAESASRQGYYREVYIEARAAAENKVHTRECRNSIRPAAGKPQGSNGCGTLAHPEWGEPGSPWRDGHKHAHALRIVGKEILLDLWKAARLLDLP